jgi:hypothetical protein
MYLLVEHLSGHQRHIVPRSLGYAMEAYRLQERRWLERHDSLQRFMYEAVVPIVIYTGERTWQAPTPFRELVKGGDAFAAFIPPTEPLQRHAVIEDFYPRRRGRNGAGLGGSHPPGFQECPIGKWK